MIYITEWDTQIKKSCQTIKKNGYVVCWKLIIAKCCKEAVTAIGNFTPGKTERNDLNDCRELWDYGWYDFFFFLFIISNFSLMCFIV